MPTATEMLAAAGPFTGLIEGYAPRPQQQAIAEAVAATIENYETLVCEAGTGTGKTLAYLVPALLSGRKVIISTGTHNLQEQLFHRDLPVALRALGRRVRTALLKGRANYLCRHRLAMNEGANRFSSSRELAELGHIRAWAGRTRSGDVAEVATIPEGASVWRLATSTAENCLGQDCPSYGECHVLRARRAAIEADLVVVNHHLFFADMALREEGFGELLPGADAVIFDEAHQLPEVATRFFGVSAGSGQLGELARDCIAAAREEAPDMPELPGAAGAVEKAARDLRLAFGVAPGRVTWEGAKAESAPARALHQLRDALARLQELLDACAERGRNLQACQRRCRDLALRVERVSDAGDDEHVRWLELTPRGFTWHMTPLEVGDLFAAHMLGQKRAWIFTSATLAVAGRFEHFARRLGLTEYRQALWESPFDFAHHTLCYLPPELPEPRDAGFVQAVVEASLPVLEASRGRAFLLFTSHQALAGAVERLRGRLRYPLLVQGEATRSELLRRFRTTPHAVLLGTGSFWEGVDVRGEALSCVIIDKLPFAAPDDPILRARCSALRAQQRDPFREVQLPQAVLALKQGAGRLIRDANDRGVLVICDSRITARGYGRVFLQSLPPMPRTRRLADVQQFFAETVSAQ